MEEQTAKRIRFSKTGPIRFISHLDLTRTFLRAFCRAGIALKVSQGFTPHPKFSFALPLSVGMESLCEIADFTPADGCTLSLDQMKHLLQEQMPAGIEILFIEERGEKSKNIALASYEITLSPFPAEKIPEAEALFAGECYVTKKSKKGIERKMDLKEGIARLSLVPFEVGIRISALLSCGGENYLNPQLLLTALAENLALPLSEAQKSIVRTGLFSAPEIPF